MTELLKSKISERVWIIVHSDLGPFSIGVWYRPPVQGETDTIKTLREEWNALSQDAVGTIIVGDMNIHHQKWLRRSASNSAEGEELHRFCLDVGMQQLVREATRDKYLLDLVLSDVEGVRCTVLPKIADHGGVLTRLKLPVPETVYKERTVWRYLKADWENLRTKLASIDWNILEEYSVDVAAEVFTRKVIEISEAYIPKGLLREKKSTHPWVNRRVVELVAHKRAAAGTANEKSSTLACSDGIKEEYEKYIEKEKSRLRMETGASKGWWSRIRRLLNQTSKTCNIPALKKENGKWCQDAKAKADHLDTTFMSKCQMEAKIANDYTAIEVPASRGQRSVAEVTENDALKHLEALRSDSATGPDKLPTQILKKCARVLAKPLCILAKLILRQGRWPDTWTSHWIIPRYKKNSVYDASNYRGVHLTAQLSKVMERVLGALFMLFC